MEYVTLKKPLISIIICILSVSCLFVGMDGSYSNNNHNKSYFNELETSPQNASSIVIGSSYIVVPENAKVVIQVDRVIKDVASNISVNTPPDQSPNSSKQLVPYMEGARVGGTYGLCKCKGYSNNRSNYQEHQWKLVHSY